MARRKEKLSKGESMYSPEIIDRVREIIFLFKPLKNDGSLHLGKVAKAIGISERTLGYWRDPESKYYKPLFAPALIAAHEELTESIDLGKTKRAMIARSQPYIKTKKTKERIEVAPKMPAMSKMLKKDLIAAAKKLGIKIKGSKTVAQLKQLITEEVQNQTKSVMVLVKEEITTEMGDVGAGKLVTSNIGPKEKRWKDKSEVEVVGQSLADIAAIMMGKKKSD